MFAWVRAGKLIRENITKKKQGRKAGERRAKHVSLTDSDRMWALYTRTIPTPHYNQNKRIRRAESQIVTNLRGGKR
jgi:hypothetical protein